VDIAGRGICPRHRDFSVIASGPLWNLQFCSITRLRAKFAFLTHWNAVAKQKVAVAQWLVAKFRLGARIEGK